MTISATAATLVAVTIFTEPAFNTAISVDKLLTFETMEQCQELEPFVQNQKVDVRINPEGRNENTTRLTMCVPHGGGDSYGEIIWTYDSRGKNERRVEVIPFQDFTSPQACAAVRDNIHLLEPNAPITFRDRMIAQVNCDGENL